VSRHPTELIHLKFKQFHPIHITHNYYFLKTANNNINNNRKKNVHGGLRPYIPKETKINVVQNNHPFKGKS
jgi:hypothetical protein